MKLLHLATLLGIGCIVAIMQCTPTTSVAGLGGSEVVGTLVTEQGTAVAGARLLAFTAGSDTACDSSVAVDSAFTNSSGIYTFTTLDTGRFDLRGDYKADSLVVLIKGVHNNYIAPVGQAANKVAIGIDTMRVPGAIWGKVAVGFDATAPVLCFIPGTSFQATALPNSEFTITGVPPGTYVLYYWYTGLGYELAKDSNIVILSGLTTSLSVKTLHLSSAGAPPAVTGLQARYDTLSGTVKLQWNSVPVSDLKQYDIYRRDGLSGQLVLVASVAKPDTVFTDAIYSNLSDTVPHALIYQVRCVDSLTEQSPFVATLPCSTVSPSVLRTFLTITANGNKFLDTVSINDNVSIVTYFHNQITTVSSLTFTWTNKADTLVRTVGLKNGYETELVSWTTTGLKTVYIMSTDAAQRTWTDSIKVLVVNDIPKITFISPDTTIDYNSAFACSVSVAHTFGKCTLFVDYNGDGVFDMKRYGNSLDTIFQTGSDTSLEKVHVKVTDNDGNRVDTSFTVTIRPIPLHDVWQGLDSLKNARKLFCAEVLNGSIYVMGGQNAQYDFGQNRMKYSVLSTVEQYDTQTQKWTLKKALNSPRYSFVSTTWNNKIYVIGGRNLSGLVKTIEEYDPASDNWAIVGTMDSTFLRAGSTACLVGNSLYMFGGVVPGSNGDSVTSDIFSYNFLTKTWSTVGEMLTERAYFCVVPIGQTMQLLGGIDNYNDPMQSTEIFDPASGFCSNGFDLNMPHSFFSAVAIHDSIYLTGGVYSTYPSDPPLSQHSLCNAVSSPGIWTDLSPLPGTRHSQASVVLNGNIFIIGGATNTQLNQGQGIDRAVLKYYP